MAGSEFKLISQYFSRLTSQRDDVVLGIGDDCALLQPPAGKQLAVSIDTLVEGVHFFADVAPRALGYKSLAVNLSDLAAMGAAPAWFTLALTLPEYNPDWLQQFTDGLAAAAANSGIQLIGGDTTRGPLTISIQVHGYVDKGQALRRDGAGVGDKVYVSGTLGDAGAAVKHRLENWLPPALNDADWQFFQQRLEYPAPRLTLGQAISQYASAAIDISDGLSADLTHILERSGKGAVINIDRLPVSSALAKLPRDEALALALGAGDDYELCFTVPAAATDKLQQLDGTLTCIGEITAADRLQLTNDLGQEININAKKGYDHFSA